MSDAYTKFENAALRALESPETDSGKDSLALMLLEAAALGRQQSANNHVALGDLAKAKSTLEAETRRSTQFSMNVTVQQTVNRRNVMEYDVALANAENRAAKAKAGKEKALANLRPAYKALEKLHKNINSDLSDKEIGRQLRVAFSEAL